jgi:hypothetical protein
MSTNAAPNKVRYRAAARAGRAPRQLWQVPTFFVGLLVFALVAAGATVRHHNRPAPGDHELAVARAALANPKTKPEEVQKLAEAALQHVGDDAPRSGEAHLLLGLAAARQANEAPAANAATLRQGALAHLERAEALGVPDADRPRLGYALGKLLYQTGGDPQRVVDLLATSVPQGADNLVEAYSLLADAHGRAPIPNLEAALQANQRVLDNSSDDRVLVPAYVARAEILMRLERCREALAFLERVGLASPPEVRLRARLLQAQCCEREGLWNKAVPVWNELLQTPERVPGGKGRILYTLGQCYLQSEPPDVEAAQKAWIQAEQEGGDEGQAATFRLAEAYLGGERPDLAAAADALKRAVERVNEPKDYQNALVDLAEARRVFELGLRAALGARAYKRAQDLAEWYNAKLAEPGVAEEWYAAASEAWARQLEEQLPAAKGVEATLLRKQADGLWRAAALNIEGAAEVQGDKNGADSLWRAVEFRRKGHDDEHAAAVLERLLKLSLPPERQAEAWYALAQTRWAAGHKSEARTAYLECLKFSASAFSYRARYQLALDKLEQNKADEAVDYLKQLLNIMNPKVDRELREQVLFKLGDLLFQRHTYEEAWVLLREAVIDYPDNPEVLAVRDHLGLCYRALAKQEYEKKKLLDDPVNQHVVDRDTKRAIFERSRLHWLGYAADTYQKLMDELRGRAERKALTPAEAKLLRKVSLALADVEYDRENFAEALRLYQELIRNHGRQREGLVACLGVGDCFTAMNQMRPPPALLRVALPEVRGMLQQVRESLSDVPDDEFPPYLPRTRLKDWLDRFLPWLAERQREGATAGSRAPA